MLEDGTNNIQSDEDGGNEEADLIGNRNFQEDFVKGCVAFMTLAMVINGEIEEQSVESKYSEFIDPIVGNRNGDDLPFSKIIPELYKKVIEYCRDAASISDRIDQQIL